jgi:hypothetical protein
MSLTSSLRKSTGTRLSWLFRSNQWFTKADLLRELGDVRKPLEHVHEDENNEAMIYDE